MSNKNGGPAFPREDYQCNGDDGSLGQEGMSLRDYFAAKAMQALIGRGWVFEGTQVTAYEIADLMIKERGE